MKFFVSTVEQLPHFPLLEFVFSQVTSADIGPSVMQSPVLVVIALAHTLASNVSLVPMTNTLSTGHLWLMIV